MTGGNVNIFVKDKDGNIYHFDTFSMIDWVREQPRGEPFTIYFCTHVITSVVNEEVESVKVTKEKIFK
nr:MAG: hypothetical protein [Lokiarchaeota virus Ratatoskr Meg22_1012]